MSRFNGFPDKPFKRFLIQTSLFDHLAEARC